MKSPAVIFRGRNFLDIAGLFAVLSLFVVNAFHYNIQSIYTYYRELFGVLFIALIALHFLIKSTTALGGALRLSRPILYLLLFPVFLLIFSVLDAGEPLYGDHNLEQTSKLLSEGSLTTLTMYVLRNALLYLPMVVYLYLRGLNKQEIRLVALTAIVIAPLSIFGYLQSETLREMELTLGGVAKLGGKGISYNSYVPYLTFHVLCGLYFIFSPGSRLIKVVAIGCLVYTALFILFSTSRQSFLFIIVTFIIFSTGHLRKQSANIYNKPITTVILSMGLIFIYAYYVKNLDLSDKLIERFGSLQGFTSDKSSQRIATATDGLALLRPLEWLSGAGLTCVINSGPHNDYVRWTQRIGIPLMIFGFLPFLVTLVRCLRLGRLRRYTDSLQNFLALVVGFTLFHSLFGYPREEANQAIAVYLGIAIWFGAYREGILNLNPRRSTKRTQWPPNRDSNHATKSSLQPLR